jgi:spore germination protein KC
MKKLIICLLLFALLFTGGCWDSKEPGSIAHVLGCGVDKAPDGNVILTLELAIPSGISPLSGGAVGSGAGTSTFYVVSEKGRTIPEAQSKISERVSRTIFWGHNLVIIFGKTAAEQGLRETLNFLYRNFEPREASWVLISKGEAREIFEKGRPVLEKTNSQAIDKLMSANGIGVEFVLFLRDMYRSGSNPAAPSITLVKKDMVAGAQSRALQEPVPGIEGLAVFKSDRLKGFLNPEETYGFHFLRGVYTKPKRLVFITPGIEEKKEISLQALRWTTRVDPVQEENNLKIFIEINLLGNLLAQKGHEDIYDMKILKKIEENASGEVEKLVRAAVVKAQGEYGTDIFGFGETYRNKYRKMWPKAGPRWDEEFAGAKIYLSVKVTVRNTGLETARPEYEKGKTGG